MSQDFATLLEQAFDAGIDVYRDRGFKRRLGYGKRPAIIHIDLANAWTKPGHAFTCEGMETIIYSQVPVGTRILIY